MPDHLTRLPFQVRNIASGVAPPPTFFVCSGCWASCAAQLGGGHDCFHVGCVASATLIPSFERCVTRPHPCAWMEARARFP